MAKEHCDEHSGCENQIETNRMNIDRIYETVDRIRNCPPVWMSLGFAVAIGAIGWLIKGL